MQRKYLSFWFMLCFLVHLRADESQQQLLEFVTQIKASHLEQCRDIALVFVELLPVASKVIQLNSDMVPMYTCDENWNAAVLRASCGIIFTTLTNSGLNQTRNFFSNKAKLLFIIDVKQGTTVTTSTVETFMSTQFKLCLFNTVVIMFNAYFSKGYYFDPLYDLYLELDNPSRSIYPTIRDLKDLQRYELHFAYVPGESDQSVITSIANSLSITRNGTLVEPLGLDPASLLNLSRTFQWHFTLLTFGPPAYATCFLVPRAELVPIGYVLVAPFDSATWCGILLTGIVIVILLKLFGKSSLFGSVIMLLQSVFTSPNRIARTYFERRILTACMLGCLVLISSYQSIIYSLISNPIYNPELDTEHLINSSCAIYMLNDLEGIDNFRETFVDDAQFINGKSCVCSSCQMKDLMQPHWQRYKKYRVSKHRTHPFPMLLALIDREYPPLTELVRLYVSAFFEAGLTLKMLQEEQIVKRTTDYFDSKQTYNTDFSSHPLAIADLQIVWIVLEMGLLCATICFFGELSWKYVKNLDNVCKRFASCLRSGKWMIK